MRILVALLLALLLPASANAEVFTQTALNPEAGFDASGRLHVVLITRNGPAAGIGTLVRAPGGAWAGPTMLDTDGSPRARLAVGSTGEAVAGWLYPLDFTVRLGSASSGAWGSGFTAMPIERGQGDWPSVAVADDGTAMAVWTEDHRPTPDTKDVRMFSSHRSPGGAWTPPEKVADLGAGAVGTLTAAPGGTFWVLTYMRFGDTITLNARRWQSGAWQAPETIPHGGGIAAHAADTPAIVQNTGVGNDPPGLQATHRAPAGTWSASQQIVADGSGYEIRAVRPDQGGVTVLLADDGVYVPGQAAKGRVGTIRYANGVWGAMETLETDSGWTPIAGGASVGEADGEFAVNASGVAAHAFSDGPALKVRIRRDGVWGTPRTVSVVNQAAKLGIPSTGNTSGPGFDVAVAPDGHVEVVFPGGENPFFGCAWRESVADLPPLCTGLADPADRDGDGTADSADNCPDEANPISACSPQYTAPPGCYPTCGTESPGTGPTGGSLPPLGRPTGITPRGLRIGKLLKAGRHRLTVGLPRPGTLELKWLKGRTVVAAGRTSTPSLTMKLTKKGRKALRRAKKVKLVAKGVYRSGDQSVNVAKAFTLKR